MRIRTLKYLSLTLAVCVMLHSAWLVYSGAGNYPAIRNAINCLLLGLMLFSGAWLIREQGLRKVTVAAGLFCVGVSCFMFYRG